MLEFAKNSATPTTTYSDKPMFKTANEFSLHIESIVREKRINYMDAVLHYCKENFLEPADVASLINKSLKDKIEMDFRELNYLPKQAKLDV
jgi:KaiC/GvpD/RAD55 family RecA-like ATPase